MWGPLTTLVTRVFWASIFFGLELWSRLRALSEARTWDGPLDGPPAPVIESTTRLHGCPAFYVSTTRPAPRAIYSLCFLACLPAPYHVVRAVYVASLQPTAPTVPTIE